VLNVTADPGREKAKPYHCSLVLGAGTTLVERIRAAIFVADSLKQSCWQIRVR